MARIVIIGASIAGHTVALKIKESCAGSSVTLLTEESYPLYDRRMLTGVLAGERKDKEVFLFDKDLYARKAIEFKSESRVISLNRDKKILSLKDKPAVPYDFLVICTGRKFSPPQIPGIKKSGVFGFSSLEDLKQLKAFPAGDTVAISGSGVWARKVAAVFASKGKEVKLLTGAPEAQEAPVVPAEGRIEAIPSSIVEIIGESEIQAVRLKEGKIVGTTIAVFMDEYKGGIEFLKHSGIEVRGDSVLVDERMRAGCDQILACGAVCALKEGPAEMKSWEETIEEGLRAADTLLTLAG